MTFRSKPTSVDAQRASMPRHSRVCPRQSSSRSDPPQLHPLEGVPPVARHRDAKSTFAVIAGRKKQVAVASIKLRARLRT